MIKVGFVTCVQLGLSCIEEIYRVGGKLDLMITLKDEKSRKKSGRIYLDDFANKHDIPLLKVNNINDSEAIVTLKKYNLDWLYVIGWSQIVKKEMLDMPNKGCIGMHPTLLPVGRGRASIPWSIIKKLDQTGVTMFKLDEGVDTGDIIAQEKIRLNNDITATELYSKVNQKHIELIRNTWKDIVNDRTKLKKQDESKATIWPGRKPDDGLITSDMTMDQALTLVRATTRPYPGAFFLKEDCKIIIWAAKTDKHSGDIKLKDGFLQFLESEEVQHAK